VIEILQVSFEEFKLQFSAMYEQYERRRADTLTGSFLQTFVFVISLTSFPDPVPRIRHVSGLFRNCCTDPVPDFSIYWLSVSDLTKKCLKNLCIVFSFNPQKWIKVSLVL
jgi:hypothetical protein